MVDMTATRNPPELPLDERRRKFDAEGVIGGIPFLTASECELLMKHVRNKPPPPQDWNKGRAATDRLIYDIAVRRPVVGLLKSLLGDSVVLWGAVIVEQSPGETHAWHTDIETSAAGAGTASIWVGLEDTNQESTLELISCSHRMGMPVQQAAAKRNLLRGQVTSEQALAWVREYEPEAMLVRPATQNGNAVVFDGRVWHSSFNNGADSIRTALVLQYAAAHVPVHMPDFSQLEWPFRFQAAPRPPTLVVCGEPNDRVNRVVPPPSYRYPEGRDRPLATHLHALPLPLAEDPKAHWRAYPVIRGRTRTLGSMSSHASVLSPGHSPHPPHQHLEEELLIILDGEAELVVVDDAGTRGTHEERVGTGSFVYYPPFVRHTIRNTSTHPVTYLMFKWRAPSQGAERTLPWQVHHYARAIQHEPDKPFWASTVFEGPTSSLSMLHAHASVVQPGAGYAPHVDGHDVALVLHSGKVKTLGKVIEGPAVIYYSAGEAHGLKNVGVEPARYLVFEFHSNERSHLEEPIPLGPSPSLDERIRSRVHSVGRTLKRANKIGRRILGRRNGLLSYFIRLHDHLGRN